MKKQLLGPLVLAVCLAAIVPPATGYSGKIKEVTPPVLKNSKGFRTPPPVVIQYNQSATLAPVAIGLAANGLFAAFINGNNQVSFTGINDQGQFGDGGINTSNNNQWEPGPFGVQSIAAGEQTLMVLTSADYALGAGYVLGAGANDDGTIGIGNSNKNVTGFSLAMTDPASPLAGRPLSGIVQIATGREHSIALDSSNRIWVAGDNDHSQLAIVQGGPWQTQCSYTAGDISPVTCVDTWRVSMTGIPPNGRVLSIGAGGDFSVALVFNPATGKNELYGAGSNVIGELGTGDEADKSQWTLIAPDVMTPTQGPTFAAGWWHLIYVDSKGRLWGTGDNSCGQLGSGSGGPACNNSRPDNDPNNPGAMLTSQYTFSFIPISINSSGSSGRITSVAAGPYNSFALFSNGDLYAAGANMTGQLGLGNYNYYQLSFVPILTNVDKVIGARYFTLAIRNGDVYYTGSIGSVNGADATVPVAGNPPTNTWQPAN